MSSVVTISHTASEENVQQDSICNKSKDPSSLEAEDLQVTLDFDSLQAVNETLDRDFANRSEMRQEDEGFTHQDSSATTAELMGSQAETENPSSTKKVPAAQAIVRRHSKNGPDALIVLKEEKVRSLTFTICHGMI